MALSSARKVVVGETPYAYEREALASLTNLKAKVLKRRRATLA
jgi:hypothetical protein